MGEASIVHHLALLRSYYSIMLIPQLIPVRPFLKWAGGKTQTLPHIRKAIAAAGEFRTYYEPFLGGGAVFFDLSPRQAVLSDLNRYLIEAYSFVRDAPRTLCVDLQKHQNLPEYYMAIRGLAKDRPSGTKLDLEAFTPLERVSRFLYLNKHCYNGLYRVNNGGEFNVPFGKYKQISYDEDNIHRCSNVLSSPYIKMRCCDYKEALQDADAGDFVYIDPPYYPLSETSDFTNYMSYGFNIQQQKELAEYVFDDLDARGVKFLLSNSIVAAPLYRNFHVRYIQSRRSINSKGEKRGAIQEILVSNYGWL